MTNQATIPASLDRPEWPNRAESVLIETGSGTLHVAALGEDDIFVEGTLTYRGKSYRVNLQHTDGVGNPKGYFYRGTEGQVFDTIPENVPYARANFFEPVAPKTYVAPLLSMVKSAVLRYLSQFPEHAAAGRACSRQQDLYRLATRYNELAAQALAVLQDHQALVQS